MRDYIAFLLVLLALLSLCIVYMCFISFNIPVIACGILTVVYIGLDIREIILVKRDENK